MLFVRLVLVLFFLSSCTTSPELRPAMFHSAMMEGGPLEMNRASLLTNLEGLDQNTGGGGCSVCAK